MTKVLPSIKSIKVFIFQAGATTGLTEVMSAVVSSDGGNINDLSFQKKQCVDTRDVEAVIFQPLPHLSLPPTKNEKTTVDNFF